MPRSLPPSGSPRAGWPDTNTAVSTCSLRHYVWSLTCVVRPASPPGLTGRTRDIALSACPKTSHRIRTYLWK